MENKLVDFDWKISTTLASDSLSQQYIPTLLLTLYYVDPDMKKQEAYFEFPPDKMQEFLEKLHSIQEVVRKVVPL